MSYRLVFLVALLAVLSAQLLLRSAPTTQSLSEADQMLVDRYKVSESEAEKLQLISQMAMKSDPRFIDTFVTAARTDTKPIRLSAVGGLGLIGDENATFELDAIANDPNMAMSIRQAACDKLINIARRGKSEAAIDSLVRIAGTKSKDGSGKDGSDAIADKAAADLSKCLTAASAKELDRLANSGSDDVRSIATAEQNRRDSGSSKSTPKDKSPAAVDQHKPSVLSDQDTKILLDYAKDRRKELSAKIAQARRKLSGPVAPVSPLFPRFSNNRDAGRAQLSSWMQEQSMLATTDGVRIGAALELTALAAGLRAHAASDQASALQGFDDMMPHVINRTEYSDGHVEEGYDAGTELGHMFLGMAATFSQMDAESASDQYAKCASIINALSPDARAKIAVLRIGILKNKLHQK